MADNLSIKAIRAALHGGCALYHSRLILWEELATLNPDDYHAEPCSLKRCRERTVLLNRLARLPDIVLAMVCAALEDVDGGMDGVIHREEVNQDVARRMTYLERVVDAARLVASKTFPHPFGGDTCLVCSLAMALESLEEHRD